MNEDKYADIRPIRGEDKYIEFDEEFDCWGIFGNQSGFCYSQHTSKHDAEETLFYQP